MNSNADENNTSEPKTATVWDICDKAQKELTEIANMFNVKLKEFKKAHNCDLFIDVKKDMIELGLCADIDKIK